MGIHQQQGIVVLAKGGWANIAHQQEALPCAAFGRGVGQQVMALGSKTHTIQRAILRTGDWAKVARMSGFSVNCSEGVWPEPSFLIFWSERHVGPPVGHCGGCYE
jgi:hypothetical protein